MYSGAEVETSCSPVTSPSQVTLPSWPKRSSWPPREGRRQKGRHPEDGESPYPHYLSSRSVFSFSNINSVMNCMSSWASASRSSLR